MRTLPLHLYELIPTFCFVSLHTFRYRITMDKRIISSHLAPIVRPSPSFSLFSFLYTLWTCITDMLSLLIGIVNNRKPQMSAALVAARVCAYVSSFLSLAGVASLQRPVTHVTHRPRAQTGPIFRQLWSTTLSHRYFCANTFPSQVFIHILIHLVEML
jgi:hypothetical protein